MDVLDGVPKRVLGHEIETGTKIFFTFLIPASLELVAYLIQTAADIGVTIQLFRDYDNLYAYITLTLILLPSFITFIAIVTSSWQWPEVERCHKENIRFLLRQIFNMLLFPVGAVVRFCRRIFWSIEALFHGENDYERFHSLEKAAETSPFELYRFTQAYAQAAPQVILQLFILLRKDLFRNYETTNVQVLSIVFSLVNIAVITMSYQRFESQKIVGRHYPWSTEKYVRHRRHRFQRTRSLTEELMKSKKRSAEITRRFPETEHIMQRFHSQHPSVGEPSSTRNSIFGKDMPTTSTMVPIASSGTQNASTVTRNLSASQKDAIISSNVTVTDRRRRLHSPDNVGVDEVDVIQRTSIPESDWSTIESTEDNLELRRKPSMDQIRIESMGSDYVPSVTPPPPPPASGKGLSFNPLNRISQFTDMLVLNAEMYIKDHVPRPPRILIERALSQEERDKAAATTATQSNKDNINDIICASRASQMTNPTSETSPRVTSMPSAPVQMRQGMAAAKAEQAASSGSGGDELDFFLPSRKKMIEGVEQDDFAGKFVSFFGWILFIYMRMISLSVFSVFYPLEFVYLVGAHYGLMLLCLAIESRLKDKCERILFHFCLAYIYIFVILEFKIKFRHVRPMYVGYFLLVLLENFIITAVWYGKAEFYSWIYDYLFTSCMVSGGLTLLCMIVYYCILRPDDVILFENIEENS